MHPNMYSGVQIYVHSADRGVNSAMYGEECYGGEQILQYVQCDTNTIINVARHEDVGSNNYLAHSLSRYYYKQINERLHIKYYQLLKMYILFLLVTIAFV